MEESKSRNTYILLKIHNWEHICQLDSAINPERVKAEISMLIAQKFQVYLETLTLQEGEFFVLLSQYQGDKSIIKIAREIQDHLQHDENFSGLNLSSSLVVFNRPTNKEAYEIFLYLQTTLLRFDRMPQSASVLVA